MSTEFAVDYQRRYRRDIFVDMVCYRRHGHNELDDPTFTNPVLYQAIRARKTLPDAYAEQLTKEGVQFRLCNLDKLYLNKLLLKRYFNERGRSGGAGRSHQAVRGSLQADRQLQTRCCAVCANYST